MTRDTIIHIDLEADINLFFRTVDLVGSEDLLSREAKHFFIGRALSYVSNQHDAAHIVDKVLDKIQTSIRAYYYAEQNTADIEKRIMDDWIVLANSFSEQLKEYMYDENGRRNNKLLALRRYETTGEVEVLLVEMENEEDEARGYLRKRYY